MDQHNRGIGGKQTRQEHLRPWGLLAYVSGFNGSRADHLAFEVAWKKEREILQQLRKPDVPTMDEIADLSKILIQKRWHEDQRNRLLLRYFKVTTFNQHEQLGNQNIIGDTNV